MGLVYFLHCLKPGHLATTTARGLRVEYLVRYSTCVRAHDCKRLRLKDRLTCAWGLQPKGRKDATREGQDGGSRRRRDDWTTASDGTCPARVAENSMPEEARPRGSPKT